MNAGERDDLEQRLAELEHRVAQLESRAAIPAQAGVGPLPPKQAAGPPTEAAPAPREHWFDFGEGWLGRVGVALVVLGLIFLYRYAVDRGWLTPAMRIALGVLIGAGMLAGGLRFFTERRRY